MRSFFTASFSHGCIQSGETASQSHFKETIYLPDVSSEFILISMISVFGWNNSDTGSQQFILVPNVKKNQTLLDI